MSEYVILNQKVHQASRGSHDSVSGFAGERQGLGRNWCVEFQVPPLVLCLRWRRAETRIFLHIEEKSAQLGNRAQAIDHQARCFSQSFAKKTLSQIERIYRFVSMRVRQHHTGLIGETKFEIGARMILDAILLTVAEISADGEAQLPVAIFPEMRVASDGVNIVIPTTKFQLHLTLWSLHV
jgi:hypothetical protein